MSQVTLLVLAPAVLHHLQCNAAILLFISPAATYSLHSYGRVERHEMLSNLQIVWLSIYPDSWVSE